MWYDTAALCITKLWQEHQDGSFFSTQIPGLTFSLFFDRNSQTRSFKIVSTFSPFILGPRYLPYILYSVRVSSNGNFSSNRFLRLMTLASIASSSVQYPYCVQLIASFTIYLLTRYPLNPYIS